MDKSAVLIQHEVTRMRDAVLFEGPERGRRQSRFWLLLVLASVIAAAGVVADSTATVIGAMIVAPMMIPIQGTVLSTVLGDRRNLVRSVIFVVAGSVLAIAIGYLVGLFIVNDVVAASNSQVASRVNPTLIDLVAALATGIVGSIALVRRDISDTLPGVAIAISLVPPLTVVGLTLESGQYSESFGALLLFITNVAAILATGIVVMTFYGVHRIPAPSGVPGEKAVNRRNAILVIVSMLLLVGIPLTLSSVSSTANTLRESTIRTTAEEWTTTSGWDLLGVNITINSVVVRTTGPLPLPDTELLKSMLAKAGIQTDGVEVEMVPSFTAKL